MPLVVPYVQHSHSRSTSPTLLSNSTANRLQGGGGEEEREREREREREEGRAGEFFFWDRGNEMEVEWKWMKRAGRKNERRGVGGFAVFVPAPGHLIHTSIGGPCGQSKNEKAEFALLLCFAFKTCPNFRLTQRTSIAFELCGHLCTVLRVYTV